MPHLLQRQLAGALGIDKTEVRVVAPQWVAGSARRPGSPTSTSCSHERLGRLGRPVTWTETRSEDMVALLHSRAQIQYCELGLSLATAPSPACGSASWATPAPIRTSVRCLPAGTKRMSNATYTFPQIRFDVVVPVTTTTPTGAYRGAGRPEAAALVERLVDQAAIELGIDPLEIRRRNFIGRRAFPFETLTGLTYDSGDYPKPLEEAARLVGYDELRAEQAARRARGDRRALGIGVASYVEVTSRWRR